MDTLVLTWGLLPLIMGLGFVFHPAFMSKLAAAYTRQAKRIQGRFLKAHRATGLSFILVGVVLISSYFQPIWIYHCFLIARVVTGALFPQMFVPNSTTPVVPIHWI